MPSSTPVRGGSVKLQESSDFFDQLNNADSFKRKPRVAHHPKPSTSPGTTYPFGLICLNQNYRKRFVIWSVCLSVSSEDRGPLVEIKIGSSFQPVESTSKVTNPLRSPTSSQAKPASAGQPKPSSLPPLPKDVAVEKYSGLRLRWGHWHDGNTGVLK